MRRLCGLGMVISSQRLAVGKAPVLSPMPSANPGGMPLEAESLITHRSERSVLDAPGAGKLTPFIVAGRSRLATCSGVAWFRGRHLCVANLYGGHVRIYRFHPAVDGAATARLELVHEMTEGIRYPEDVAISPDGAMLAVANSVARDAGISLHRIDPIRQDQSRPKSSWPRHRFPNYPAPRFPRVPA